MVADEGALAKDEVQRLRRRRELQMLREPAGAHHASVSWRWRARVDELARARVNAISTDQHSAFGGGAVRKGRDHAALAHWLSAGEFLAKVHLDALALGFL